MTTGNKDIDTIASEPKPLTLESGFPILIQPLRTRALMSLFRILTVGAGEAITALRFEEGVSEDDFTAQMIASILFAIPEAEKETIEFINRMVEPADTISHPRTKADAQRNAELQQELAEALYDPKLEDLLTIVSEIIRIEAPHMLALGKQLAALIQTMRKSRGAASTESTEKKPARSSKSASKASTQTD